MKQTKSFWQEKMVPIACLYGINIFKTDKLCTFCLADRRRDLYEEMKDAGQWKSHIYICNLHWCMVKKKIGASHV